MALDHMIEFQELQLDSQSAEIPIMSPLASCHEPIGQYQHSREPHLLGRDQCIQAAVEAILSVPTLRHQGSRPLIEARLAVERKLV